VNSERPVASEKHEKASQDESETKDRNPASPAEAKKDPPRGKSQTAQRHEKRRAERMKEIREQVADGSLVIREMTAEERKKYPPRPRKPKRGKR
jgi:hypothetical protein